MPKAQSTTPRPNTKTKTSGPTRYQNAVNAIAELTPHEQMRLMAKLQKKSISPGRAQLIREVRQAEEEIARGEFFVGTAEEVIRELNR